MDGKKLKSLEGHESPPSEKLASANEPSPYSYGLNVGQLCRLGCLKQDCSHRSCPSHCVILEQGFNCDSSHKKQPSLKNTCKFTVTQQVRSEIIYNFSHFLILKL